MKLYERPRIDKELDRLPELPEGVEVPDDISGLQPPTTLKATGGAIRWMRWLAVILVLGAIGLAGVLVYQSYSTTEIDQADVYGSDRHLAALETLRAEQITVDYMATYGTDNPDFVQPEFVYTGRLMELYGTDNPVFVQAEVVDTAEGALNSARHMELYGTDNPVFVHAGTSFDVEYTDMYGTESLAFVESDPAGAAFRAMEPTWQPNLGALEQALDPVGARFRAMEPTLQPNLGALEQILDPVGARLRAMEPTWQPNYTLLDSIIVQHPYADFFG